MQSLEEGHEVPYSEDVRLHEESQMLRRADAGVEWVLCEAAAQRRDARLDGFDGCGCGDCVHISIIALEQRLDCAGYRTVWQEQREGGESLMSARLYQVGCMRA